MRGGPGGAVGRSHRHRLLALAVAVPFLSVGLVARAGLQLQTHVRKRAVAADKSGHPTVMIAVRMAEYQTVELFRRDAEQVEITVEHLGGETEIEEILIAPSRRLGFEMQRQAPFAGE